MPVRARDSSASENENGARPRPLAVSSRTRGLTTRANALARAATPDDNGGASEPDDNGIRVEEDHTAPTKTRGQASRAGRAKVTGRGAARGHK